MMSQIGGQTKQQALDSLRSMTEGVQPIGLAEYQSRIKKAQQLMRQHGIDALYLNAGTNLSYFTGTVWYASERLVGALLFAEGSAESELLYISPVFEIPTLSGFQVVQGEVLGWHEDENPYQLMLNALKQCCNKPKPVLALDDSSAFFIFEGLRQANPQQQIVSGKVITQGCRAQKSEAEIAIMQRAMDMTLAVHKAVASILYEGISTSEVEAFIDEAHRKVGASGSYFCIVLFGPDSAYPHGVKTPKHLESGDMVLIDTGCRLLGYVSDITRSYVFGTPSERQREIWAVEKAAQAAAFNAAKPGMACGLVDVAAREVIEAFGLGPDYALPGLPHRTGHGIGMDIHEGPYLVRNEQTLLAPGMCFSNEPMICVPDEFGVRLEDHFYMTTAGPRWFTEPAVSIEQPFA
ncbi:MAG: Xaa-Pro peptidase family protein [Gammaproteobacteria bacterium]|nr:Xaa-Pro peptidase family protein [Gammaproteobacteria bacterium]MBU2057438.1 Xaa-Pro peptidase family protein [Gammaproteobacteria bacterium]MBU2176834.1 Xaa-Pro peptidase family protein [Gammaproteobacteria bacterium]MBU2247946.1 Xaa-Pro peptidase family protein [Gammaproteobacteria bacterium]MBU2342840.1 Xaa-Pro peptidase family protein [Gammaproteobacteria bacterium]